MTLRRTLTTLTIAILLVAVAVLAGLLVAQHHATDTANAANVTQFNDGWATAEQNDCNHGHGYQAACAWLHQIGQ